MESEIAAEDHKLDDQQLEATEESGAHTEEKVQDEFPAHEEPRTDRVSNESKGVDRDEGGDNGEGRHGGEHRKANLRFVEENLWKTEIGTIKPSQYRVGH